MLRSAIMGCGHRAREHAVAYECVKDAQLIAVCDINEQRLNEFADEFNVEYRFTDVERMLEVIQPELLHIVTQPNVRVEPIALAARMGVRGIICEKPIALRPSELQCIVKMCEEHDVRLVINHQKRMAPVWERLRQFAQRDVERAHTIIGTSGLNLMGQGSHMIDQILALTGEQPPSHVLAHVWGAEDYQLTHTAPSSAMLTLWWDNGLRAYLEFGKMSPRIEGEPSWAWYQITVYGDAGCAWVQLNSGLRLWHRNGYEHIPCTWMETNRAGQVRLTQAMIDWLLERRDDHPCSLRWGRVSFEIIMAGYRSALEERIVPFPIECTDEHWYALRDKVMQATEGNT